MSLQLKRPDIKLNISTFNNKVLMNNDLDSYLNIFNHSIIESIFKDWSWLSEKNQVILMDLNLQSYLLCQIKISAIKIKKRSIWFTDTLTQISFEIDSFFPFYFFNIYINFKSLINIKSLLIKIQHLYFLKNLYIIYFLILSLKFWFNFVILNFSLEIWYFNKSAFSFRFRTNNKLYYRLFAL